MTATVNEPTQASVARMRRFGIRPNRKLGQNFLIDDNILAVIGERASLAPKDVVLEVGGGLGVLSEFLAERVAHVHVIEIDERLRAPLEDAVGTKPNVALMFADAARTDFSALDPKPSKLVANLPYGVAATTVIKAFYELPDLSLACVMTQREVAERLTAEPGSKLYGVSSVLAQAVASDVSMRKLSRNIFHPVPNVDSALVTLRRTAANPPAGFSDLVNDAFAHRRKPLPGSLALARRDSIEAAGLKERAILALARLGYDADTRAERLTAAEFRALQTQLERPS